jgi:four helix bundle protein
VIRKPWYVCRNGWSVLTVRVWPLGMEKLGYVRSFRDLLSYKLSFELSREIFDLSKQFPEEEKYSLTSQIRRSSRSIGAQLAEAWAKRRYERHFVSKLTDADGEQMETQHWVGVASSCGYIDHETTTKLLNELQRIGQLVQEMIDSAESFCSASRAKEEPVDHES